MRSLDKTPLFLNCQIEADDVIIEGFNCTFYSQILTYGSKKCIIKDNDFMEVGFIWISQDSDNITLINNYLLGTPYHDSIVIDNSTNIYMRNNVFINTSFSISGIELEHYIHNIDDSNIFDGKPINYIINKKDVILNYIQYPNSGPFMLINSSNIVMKDLNLTSTQGFLIAYSKDIRIENSYGSISFLFSKDVTIIDNLDIAINMKGCYNILIEDNIVDLYSLKNSSNVSVYNNIIQNIWMEIIASNNITMMKNNFTQYAKSKTHIMITQSNNGTVYNNIFVEKYITINDSPLWRFYYNNFFNTTVQYDRECFSHLVFFDNGYPEGNYWNTYDGSDDYTGPALNSIGKDGIGDTPIEIFTRRNEGSWFDHYPIMNPITDAGLTTAISQPNTGSMKIRIEDNDGNRISDVRIISLNQPSKQDTLNGTTLFEGEVMFEKIQAGNFEIKASKNGYSTVTFSVNIPAGENIEMTVQLSKVHIQEPKETPAAPSGIPGFGVESIVIGFSLGLLLLYLRAQSKF